MDILRKIEKKRRKIWWIEKIAVLLHPQSKESTASVAQLVRAPDC